MISCFRLIVPREAAEGEGPHKRLLLEKIVEDMGVPTCAQPHHRRGRALLSPGAVEVGLVRGGYGQHCDLATNASWNRVPWPGVLCLVADVAPWDPQMAAACSSKCRTGEIPLCPSWPACVCCIVS